MNGIEMIRQERARQRSKDGEGYSKAHDRNHHSRDELAIAAMWYAMPDRVRGRANIQYPYGWHFKPSPDDRIRELVKAGALIAAEIDRLLWVERRGWSWSMYSNGRVRVNRIMASNEDP